MSHDVEFVPRGRRLAEADRDWASELVSRVGLLRAAKAIGIHRSALSNALAGLTVYPGTLAMIHEARRAEAPSPTTTSAA